MYLSVYFFIHCQLFGPRCGANKIINRCGHGVFHTCEVDLRANPPPSSFFPLYPSFTPYNTLAYITCTVVISPGSFITWMREGLTPYAHLRAHWNHLFSSHSITTKNQSFYCIFKKTPQFRILVFVSFFNSFSFFLSFLQNFKY